MIRTVRALSRDEGGQAIVLLAVAMPVLLGLMLLVLDGGRLYVERERLHGAAQLAADAGFSAFRDLPPGQAKDRQRMNAVVDPIVRRALERNLEEPCASDGSRPCRYRIELAPGADPDRLGVKVHVTRPFAASVQVVRFTIGAEGASGTAAQAPRAPVVVITPTPSPTPTPPLAATALPVAATTPSPTLTPPIAAERACYRIDDSKVYLRMTAQLSSPYKGTPVVIIDGRRTTGPIGPGTHTFTVIHGGRTVNGSIVAAGSGFNAGRQLDNVNFLQFHGTRVTGAGCPA